MFTPQRKLFPSARNISGAGVADGGRGSKVNAMAFADEMTPPPIDSLRQNSFLRTSVNEDYSNDWRRFKEVGLLNQASMERKDREALLEKVSKLAKELFDYQHNMGLLLIEKKKWTSDHEELSQALAEVEEILKREQTANLIALSEAEKREEKLRKALIVEKHSVTELENALRYLQEEHSQEKVTSEAKLAEAKSLIVDIEEKAIEVEKKRHVAEEKLLEVNRKHSEIEIKLKGVESGESLLQRERLSLVTEKEAHEATFYKQREELCGWEKKLTEGEQRLSELKSSLNQREEKVIENERSLKQKERSLEEAKHEIHLSLSKLKEREGGLDKRLAELASKEEEADSVRNGLQMKEKELHDMEDGLIAREQVEIEKLHGDQRAALDMKRKEFDLKLEKKRKSLDEEFCRKQEEAEHQETEINRKDEKLSKKETVLDKKSERVKQKEKDLEARLKTVGEKEKSLKLEEKKLQMEKQQLFADRESLCKLKDEIEEMGADTTQQELRIREEHEKLRVAKEDRSEFIRLQFELKQQMEKCKHQDELLLKEREGLRQERNNFEKEWSVLDEKRVEISREQREISDEKEKLKWLQLSEEERLKRDDTSLRDYLRRELDDIKLQKEAFEANTENEKRTLYENLKSEKSQILLDVETQRLKLEMELQRKQVEREKNLHTRIAEFEEKSKKQLNNIDLLKNFARMEIEEVESERLALQKQKEEVAMHKKKLKEEQTEMCKDVDDLGILGRNLKKSREQFICERDSFLVLVDKLKNCNNCGEITREFVLSDLQLPDADEVEPLLPLQTQQADTNLRRIKKSHDGVGSGRQTSWLQNATSKAYTISLGKKTEHVISLAPQQNLPLHTQVNDLIMEAGDEYEPSTANESYMDGRSLETPHASQKSDIKTSKHTHGKPRKNKTVSNRSCSAKTVTEDAKVSIEENPRKWQRGQTSKMTESEQDTVDCDDHADSVTAGGRRKRRQMMAQVPQSQGLKRYNLRRHKTAGTDAAQISINPLNTAVKDDGAGGNTQIMLNPEAVAAPSFGGNGESSEPKEMVEVTNIKSSDFLKERIIGVETTNNATDGNAYENPMQLNVEGSDAVDNADDDAESGSTMHVDDYEDDETEHPGKVSIGKKIWTFFTT